MKPTAVSLALLGLLFAAPASAKNRAGGSEPRKVGSQDSARTTEGNRRKGPVVLRLTKGKKVASGKGAGSGAAAGPRLLSRTRVIEGRQAAVTLISKNTLEVAVGETGASDVIGTVARGSREWDIRPQGPNNRKVRTVVGGETLELSPVDAAAHEAINHFAKIGFDRQPLRIVAPPHMVETVAADPYYAFERKRSIESARKGNYHNTIRARYLNWNSSANDPELYDAFTQTPLAKVLKAGGYELKAGAGTLEFQEEIDVDTETSTFFISIAPE